MSRVVTTKASGMHSIHFFVACLAATSCLAAPASPAPAQDSCFNSAYDWSPQLAEYYFQVSKDIQGVKNGSLSVGCDKSKVSLPAYAVANFPSPTGQNLTWVAVGRGVQNYTCTNSTAQAKPIFIGALASLYDATCIAANYPDVMSILPEAVYSVPVPPEPSMTLPPANLDLLGHHYFQGPKGKTPTFNLDTTPNRQYGLAMANIGKILDAPAGSYAGTNGEGAVTWLYLTTIANKTVGGYSTVYRVNTAGGQPPATCENQPGVISVQYSASYYFYK